jgi:hypothetical protein
MLAQTTRTLVHVRGQVKEQIADDSGRAFTDDELDRRIRDVIGDVVKDLEPSLLPHLHTHESFTTSSGQNAYDVASAMASSVVRIVSMTIDDLPVVPMTETEKTAVLGNTTNWPATARPSRRYHRGDGNIELYCYGTADTDYPEDKRVYVEYIQLPSLNAQDRLPFSDAVADLLHLRTAYYVLMADGRESAAQDLDKTYWTRVNALNARAREGALL